MQADNQPPANSPPRGLGIALLTALCVLFPPVFALLKAPDVAPFKYFADDAFYYLSVARNSANVPFFSFDGSHATNGFHPLWQWTEYAILQAFPGRAQEPRVLVGLLLLGAAAVAVGCFSFAATLRRLGVRPGVILVGTLLLPSYLLAILVLPHIGAIWSQINGMESPFALLFAGLSVAFAFGPRQTWLHRPLGVAGLSVLLTLGTLARLDDVFAFLPLFALLWLRRRALQRPWACVAVAGAIPTAVLSAYLAYNWHTVGALLPLSGAAKAGFALPRNLMQMLAIFVPANAWADRSNWGQSTFVCLQLLLPPACLALWLADRRVLARLRAGETLTPLEALMATAGLYVLAKSSYNFVFVSFAHQGYWYAPVPQLFGSLVLADWLADLPVLTRSRARAGVVTALSVALATTAWCETKQASPWHVNAFRTWQSGERVAAALHQQDPAAQILEITDGIVAFGVGLPTMSGTGLAGDVEAAAAKKRGNLLELAWKRGFHTLSLPAALEAAPVVRPDVGCAFDAALGWYGARRAAWRVTASLWDAEAQRLYLTIAPRAGQRDVLPAPTQCPGPPG